jgi:hypothetical protein
MMPLLTAEQLVTILRVPVPYSVQGSKCRMILGGCLRIRDSWPKVLYSTVTCRTDVAFHGVIHSICVLSGMGHATSTSMVIVQALGPERCPTLSLNVLPIGSCSS